MPAETEFVLLPDEIVEFHSDLLQAGCWFVLDRWYQSPTLLEVRAGNQYLEHRQSGNDRVYALNHLWAKEPMRTRLVNNIHAGPTYVVEQMVGGPYLEVPSWTDPAGQPSNLVASLCVGYKRYYKMPTLGIAVDPPQELKQFYQKVVRLWKARCICYKSRGVRRTWWVTETAREQLRTKELEHLHFQFDHKALTISSRERAGDA